MIGLFRLLTTMVALRPGTLLICADDDFIARKGYKPRYKLSKAEDSMAGGYLGKDAKAAKSAT